MSPTNTRGTLARRLAPGLLALAAACGGSGGEDPCARPSQSIVFYDQSASSVLDSATSAMFRDTLSGLVDSRLRCRGDAVHAFLLHGNTRGKINRVEVINDVTPPDTIGKTTLDQSMEKNRFEEEWTTFREGAQKRLLSLPSAPVDARFRRQTDVLGSLEVISTELARADSGGSVRIYYFGDMHESMSPPRRNFDARPPRTREEAEQWADADAKLLKEMSIDTARFRGAEVRVLLGNLAAKPNAQEVRMYWERLFRNAGFDAAKIEYN